MNENVISVNNLSFKYEGGESILENISFKINKGDLVLLTGPSGKGKSTLIYLLSGIIPNIIRGKAEGEILINGENIFDKKVNEICKHVGIVLQNADNQIVEKYVENELSFGAENIGIKSEIISKKIELILKILNLNPNEECRKLSGGQKQKLIIGSTLLMGQRIIILDEPLANLDQQTALDLLKILKSLCANGYTVLIAEHRIDFVLPFIDYALKLDNKGIEYLKDKDIFLAKDNRRINYSLSKTECKNLLFSLNNVSYSIKKRNILNSINLKIHKGEKILLLGQNGAGKTTFLRLLARLNKPSQGKIDFKIKNGDKTIKRANKKRFKKVGVVYQNPNYQLFMKTVKDEIYFNCYSHEYANYIIKLFKIDNLLMRHPQSLSEGQKRKVSIAAILAMKPEVLLLDEPTVGQDYDSLKDLISIINRIHEETNNTIISITHDIRCAEALCDRSVLLEEGTIRKVGNKDLVNEFFA